MVEQSGDGRGRDGQRGGRGEVDGCWHVAQSVSVDRDEFGSGTRPLEDRADWEHTPHPFAYLEPADVSAALLNLAGEVDSDAEGEPVAGDDLQLAGPRADLAAIETGRADADEHLSPSRLGDRDLVELEDLRWSVSVVAGGEHVRSSRSRFGGSTGTYDAVHPGSQPGRRSQRSCCDDVAGDADRAKTTALWVTGGGDPSDYFRGCVPRSQPSEGGKSCWRRRLSSCSRCSGAMPWRSASVDRSEAAFAAVTASRPRSVS